MVVWKNQTIVPLKEQRLFQTDWNIRKVINQNRRITLQRRWTELSYWYNKMSTKRSYKLIQHQVMEPQAWGYYSSGGDDEITLRDNHLAFQRTARSPKRRWWFWVGLVQVELTFVFSKLELWMKDSFSFEFGMRLKIEDFLANQSTSQDRLHIEFVSILQIYYTADEM